MIEVQIFHNISAEHTCHRYRPDADVIAQYLLFSKLMHSYHVIWLVGVYIHTTCSRFCDRILEVERGCLPRFFYHRLCCFSHTQFALPRNCYTLFASYFASAFVLRSSLSQLISMLQSYHYHLDWNYTAISLRGEKFTALLSNKTGKPLNAPA